MPFKVEEQAWTVFKDVDGARYTHWAAVISNPNSASYGAFPKLPITAKED